MKNLKLILDDEEESDIVLGLIRLIKPLPDYELFFRINELNPFFFQRIEDFKISGMYYDYYFSRFESYSRDHKARISITANKSTGSIQTKYMRELFSGEEEHRLLLTEHEDVDYIIKTSDSIHDFSLILFPENLIFAIQKYSMSSDHELYPLIQYYE
ncbi:MAG: IPExxxVDY family protein [Bergeyella sp.]